MQLRVIMADATESDEQIQAAVNNVVKCLVDAVCADDESDDGIEQAREATADTALSELTGGFEIFAPAHSHLLLYIEGGAQVDAARAARLFNGIATMLRDGELSASLSQPISTSYANLLARSLVNYGTASLARDSADELLTSYNMHVAAVLGMRVLMNSSFALTMCSSFLQAPLIGRIHLRARRHAASLTYCSHAPFITCAHIMSTVQRTHVHSSISWTCGASRYASLCRSNLHHYLPSQLAVLSALSALLEALGAQVLNNLNRAFTAFVYDTLDQCKLQKTLLHSLIVLVHRDWEHDKADSRSVLLIFQSLGNNVEMFPHREPLTSSILRFNTGADGDEENDIRKLVESYEASLLNTLVRFVELEYILINDQVKRN